MKRFPVQIAIAALAAISAGCINNDYDLSKLDTEVTILPGLTIPISTTDGNMIDLNDRFINDGASHSTTKEDGTIVIGRKEESQVSVVAPSAEEVKEKAKYEKVEIPLPGSILIPCADEFSRLAPNASFSIPLRPVLEITNPTELSMDFTATVKCGSRQIEVGPYKVSGGLSQITVDDESVQELFFPIKDNILITDMMLTCEEVEDSSAPRTRADDSGVISVYGYLPLALQGPLEGGKKITIEYSVKEEELLKIDIAQLKEEYKFTVPAFTVSADITSNIPMGISASATAKVDTKTAKGKDQGPFSFGKDIAAGSISSPVTTTVSAAISLDNDTESFSEIIIKAECTPAADFSFTEGHTLAYSNLKLTFTDGVTLTPGK